MFYVVKPKSSILLKSLILTIFSVKIKDFKSIGFARSMRSFYLMRSLYPLLSILFLSLRSPPHGLKSSYWPVKKTHGFFKAALTGKIFLVLLRDTKRREKSCYILFCMLTFFFKGYFQGIQAKGKGIGRATTTLKKTREFFLRAAASHTKEKITTLFPSKPTYKNVV